jgi:hypothetical protein
VVFQNGAFASDMQQLHIGGNMLTAATQYAALTVTGSGGGGASFIGAGNMSMGVECDDAAHSPAPYTIRYGSGSNFIDTPTGYLDFQGMANSNKLGGFNFIGPIGGDSALAAGSNFWQSAVAFPSGLATGAYNSAGTVSTGSTVNPNGAAFAPVTAGSACTGLVISGGAADGQVATIANQSAFSLTFAAAGTSHVADGTADTISALTARTFFWDAESSLWYRTS